MSCPRAESPAGRAFLARLVWAHHLALLILLALGWALPWTWSLWAALIVYPLVQLNWCLFGNRCVLTVLEEKLRSVAHAPVADAGADEPLHFVQALGSRLLGRPLSRSVADALSYGAVWGGFAIAGMRLYFRV